MEKRRFIDLSSSHKIILIEKEDGGIWWLEHDTEEEYYALMDFQMAKTYFLEGDNYTSEKFEDYLHLFTEDYVDLGELSIDEEKWKTIEENLEKMYRKEIEEKSLNYEIKLDTNQDKIKLDFKNK